ncbi:TraC family protein, partial [Escherichia coli]
PINGANESIVEALDHMLRTKLPRGIPLCIHLMSSQLVGDRIEYGLREFSWSGEQAERFNAITRAYYMKAAATQFPLPEGMNLPLTLRHYRVFISYCSPSKKKSRADILEMENLVKIIRASLQGASITTQTVDAQAFIDIVGEMINHNPDSLYPKRRQLDPYSDLNYQCVEDSFDLKVRADYLTLGLRENGRNSTARILNFHLARNPEIAFLWNVADNYSNLLNPELSISCPFILTLTLVVEDQVKTHSEANLKYMDLEKKSKTSYAKWFPSVEKEAKEWGELRQRLGSGQSSVVSYFLNITAFCKDNNETALEVEQDILNSFRKNGFELISPRFNHMRNFLTCLPFMAGKGLFKQLKEAGVVQRAESFNVANLMPLVADNPLTPAGLLAPTYRNQLAFIDIFFRGMNNTNYNMAVCGTSGAGKTGLIQPLIRSVLDSGGFAVVFDMGDGYKSLCENMGGVYLDGETLRFNPFANITDIDQSAERVRDQLSVMASPNGTRMILETSDRFTVVQGYAGVGKTTQFRAVMSAVNMLPESERPRVVGLGPTHRAVGEMRSAGVDAQTLASFLHDTQLQQRSGETPDFSNTLFLLDESSMVGNTDMARAYALIAAGGGRAVASGDTDQLQAIAPGQPFRLQQTRSAADVAIMK